MGRTQFSTPSADRLVAVFYVIDDVTATLRSEYNHSHKKGVEENSAMKFTNLLTVLILNRE